MEGKQAFGLVCLCAIGQLLPTIGQPPPAWLVCPFYVRQMQNARLGNPFRLLQFRAQGTSSADRIFRHASEPFQRTAWHHRSKLRPLRPHRTKLHRPQVCPSPPQRAVRPSAAGAPTVVRRRCWCRLGTVGCCIGTLSCCRCSNTGCSSNAAARSRAVVRHPWRGQAALVRCVGQQPPNQALQPGPPTAAGLSATLN